MQYTVVIMETGDQYVPWWAGVRFINQSLEIFTNEGSIAVIHGRASVDGKPHTVGWPTSVTQLARTRLYVDTEEGAGEVGSR